MLKLRADTAGVDVPDEALAVDSSRDEDGALATASSAEKVNEDESLNRLALVVALELADNVTLREGDELDLTAGASNSGESTVGRNSEGSNTVS